LYKKEGREGAGGGRRIDEIYDVLGVSNGSKLPLIENTKNTIDTPVTDDNLAGIIDGDGCF